MAFQISKEKWNFQSPKANTADPFMKVRVKKTLFQYKK